MPPFDLASLRRLDQAHHLHPFTDHRAMHREGTHIVRSAKGCTLTFEDGREVLDALAGLWCVNVGYGREEIAEAVAEQMRRVAFYPPSSTPRPSRPSAFRPAWRSWRPGGSST
jgi:putrescine aminotransferase